MLHTNKKISVTDGARLEWLLEGEQKVSFAVHFVALDGEKTGIMLTNITLPEGVEFQLDRWNHLMVGDNPVIFATHPCDVIGENRYPLFEVLQEAVTPGAPNMLYFHGCLPAGFTDKAGVTSDGVYHWSQNLVLENL